MQSSGQEMKSADNKQQDILSVLLVEDDEDDYLLTLDLFDEAYGKQYSLTWSRDPDDAMVQLDASQFDICLVDYRLGSKTGLDLIKLIHKDGFSKIPTILLTGLDSHDLDLQATNAGATDYLVKNQLKAEILERSIRYSLHQWEAESRVRHMAFHDPLTEIANRSLFAKYLERSINMARRHHEYTALLFIDLDNFKSVNDSLGHSVGDQLIVEISQRLLENIRDEDIVSRFGGDEFALLISRLDTNKQLAHEQANHLTEKIRKVVGQSMNISGNELRIGCSIGVTLFNNEITCAETLLKQADMAMYKAKNDGKNAVRFFESEMEDLVKTNYWVEQELHEAIEKDQLELYYQPIVRISDEKITGVEALIRWHHPERGLIMPNQFIPTAENSNFVCQIGKKVIHDACHFISNSPELELININISPRHFENKSFVDDLIGCLKETGVSAEKLVIEITESLVLKNARVAREKMDSLRAMGLRFALDDFGTGYSSLSILKDLPFNYLKIDGSFINELASNNSSGAITEAIMRMSEALGMQVIAECVENAEQLEFLKLHNCEFAQGYFFSEALPADKIKDLL